ncbi:MAG: hypothetical protein IKW84_09020 [Bacteroidaceae bacterium]|nr:hypothetical protein [Bacteroidaceae bacterium]MBR5159704.1 hypothetical protein [Bacteroidaceae bacterium]
MSKTDSLHYQLCIEGAKWLRRQKWNFERCRQKPCYNMCKCGGACKKHLWVAVELVTWGSELTDVWGLGAWDESSIIEVKTSHADFKAEQKKWARSDEARDMQLQTGTFRWYLCPEGIIKKEELPDKWGLLYWDGKKIYPVVSPVKFENTSRTDLHLLTSILKREEFPQKIYNYRGARTTIKPK